MGMSSSICILYKWRTPSDEIKGQRYTPHYNPRGDCSRDDRSKIEKCSVSKRMNYDSWG